MRRVDAYRHPGQTLQNADMGEVDEVPVGVARCVFIPRRQKMTREFLRREVLGGVQRFVQSDPEPSLQKDRELLLTSDGLQQFEVLDVPGRRSG